MVGTMAKIDDSVKKKVPELRFKGFTDEWEERKLSDIADRFDNLRVPITASDRKPGDTPYYGANGIQDYVEGFTHNGEFILVAEDGANDLKNYPVQYVNGRVWVNNHAHVLQGKKTITDNKFLMNAIKNFNIEPFLVGGGRAKLNADVMMKLNILLPTFVEQEKIGSLFSLLDKTIALHQRKLDLLKEQKKGYLQKMFPKNGAKVPELRFAGFADDWEERKLGDIAPLRGGFAFKSSKFRNTGVPIVRISNILSSGEVGGDFAYYDEQDKDDKYILPDKSAVLAMSGATTGKVSILSQTDYDKVYQNQRVGYFQSVDYIDYGFISTIVRSELFMMQLESVLVSGAQPNVSSKEIDSFNFMIPILVQEQQKIGSFFK